MYDGVPSVRLEGNKDRALALLPEAKALLYKVQNFLKKAEVNTFAMTQRIDDDTYLYALSANGVNVLQISVAPHAVDLVEEPESFVPEEGTARLFPDFYSGLVFGGSLRERTREGPDGETIRYLVCTGFVPTPQCDDFFDEVASGLQDAPRLAVTPWVAFSELENEGSAQYTQYTKLRPSMYSGKMKKIVQLVMGFGRLGKAKIDGAAPKKYVEDVAANGVQVRYDYKFVRTHGITVGADGRLWLVEISITRGVIARLLPIFPDSDKVSFLNRARGREDRAMEYALEELGCLPTGEAFPSGVNYDALVARGEILQLLTPADLNGFYKCAPYSSSLGWAFNERGNEAHNTAYYFGEDGFQRGVWWQISLSIGPTDPDWVPGQPLAVGSASAHLMQEGYLYCPDGLTTRYVPMKYYEPMLPGLQSHDAAPDVGAVGPVPKVDTVMFVSFVDEDFKQVRYYRNPVQDTYDNIDDPRYPGECILAGSWTITEVSGSRSFSNMMYTNDFDDRKVLQEHTKITTITSVDIGFDPPQFSDFTQAPEACFVWRNKVFRRTTTVDDRGGETVGAVVAIPQYSREAFYYATGNAYNLGRSGSTNVTFDYVQDPNHYYGWRKFPRLAGIPWPNHCFDTQYDCGVTHTIRYIVCYAYEPGYGGPWVIGGGAGAACHEFADSGPWAGMCMDVVALCSAGIPHRVGSSSSWNLGNDGKASLKLVSPGYGGYLELPLSYSQFANRWMIPSPDPITHIVQSIHATHSALGDDALVYMTDLVGYGELRAYGYVPTVIQGDDAAPCFLGVNKS